MFGILVSFMVVKELQKERIVFVLKFYGVVGYLLKPVTQ